jgi:hypothetical protein
MMAALERVLDKSRNGDLSQTISEVYARITQLCGV